MRSRAPASRQRMDVCNVARTGNVRRTGICIGGVETAYMRHRTEMGKCEAHRGVGVETMGARRRSVHAWIVGAMCRTSNVVCNRNRSCQKFNALRKIASLSRATVKIIKLRGCPKRPGNPIGFRAHRLNIETPVRCHAATSVRKTHRNNDMQNATKHRFFGNTRDEATKRQTPPTSRFPTIFRRDA